MSADASNKRSFTDIFIKSPVLAVVVNLIILAVGWRSISGLPVRQYPRIESSSVVITTLYIGRASAETIRGFITTPIERCRRGHRRYRLHRKLQRRRPLHHHRPPEAQPQQHRRTRRDRGTTRSGTRRTLPPNPSRPSSRSNADRPYATFLPRLHQRHPRPDPTHRLPLPRSAARPGHPPRRAASRNRSALAPSRWRLARRRTHERCWTPRRRRRPRRCNATTSSPR